jgi:hypothetical protein
MVQGWSVSVAAVLKDVVVEAEAAIGEPVVGKRSFRTVTIEA